MSSILAAARVVIILAAATTTACAAPPASLPILAPAPPIGAGAGTPATADFNGDRASDLLVPTRGGLVVLLSDGAGRFSPAAGSPFPLPHGGSEVALGDVDADGTVDVALADHDSHDVAVLLGDGAGGFAAAAGSPFPARRGGKPHTHGLAFGEFNRDGKPDLAVANNDGGDIALLLGDGKGGFALAPRSPFPCGPSPYPIAVADLDGDGNGDVLVPNAVHHDMNIRTLTVLRGDGNGGLAPAPGSPVRISGGAFFAAAGDVNGDGRPDALVTHSEGDDRLTILLNDGRGGLRPAPASPLKLGHNSWGVAAADMDRDGKADLVAAGGNAVRVFLGDGRGNFKPAPGSPFETGKGTWRFSLADFNADGKPDVVAKCVEEDRLAILMGQ